MSSFIGPCGTKNILPVPFVTGAISTITCSHCGKATDLRSPIMMTEEEMVSQLNGDVSPLAIEMAPPRDGTPSAHSTLPSLQLAEFYITDATGTPVHLDWLGKLLGPPGAAELPAAGVAARAKNDSGVDAEALTEAATNAASHGEGLLVRLEKSDDSKSKRKTPSAPKPKKPPGEKKPRAKRPKLKRKGAEGADGEMVLDDAEEAPKADGGEEDGEGEEEGEEEDDEEFNWACCDRCDKWRRLPDGAEYATDALPEKWFCYMNPNSKRNSCDKPQERMGRGEIWGEGEGEGEEEEEEEGEGEDDDEDRDRGTCVAPAPATPAPAPVPVSALRVAHVDTHHRVCVHVLVCMAVARATLHASRRRRSGRRCCRWSG